MMFIALLICCYIPSAFQVYTPEFLAKLPSVDFSCADAVKTDVSYYLFKNHTQTTAITLTDGSIITDDNNTIPVKFLIHGYTSNVTSPWFKEIKKEYFRKGPHNIIYVDWSIASNKSFKVSAANIKPIGEYIAEFIVNLRIPVENIHLIGHSLGSHLAGFVGRNVYTKVGKKVSRITATDPAGPGFERVGPEARLSKHDAAFVDVYHTDAGYYGIIKPIGHVDFYVNGGKFQLGCPARKVDDNCSHARSNIYFIESINTAKVKAKSAKISEAGEVVPSSKLEEVDFGDAVPSNARGIFYLETNQSAPFLVS